MNGIQLINPNTGKPLREDARGLVDTDGNVFPLVNGAYRFVSDDNYTASFGFQWNRFAQTQLDRFNRASRQSFDRFTAVTRWDIQNLQGNILEVGSGAGRFSQIVLNHSKATLFSADYSDAVSANFRNNGPHPRLKLFQASIYELPFARGQFDRVFCFGVLQHTPDFQKSVAALAAMVRPGGELVVDFYPVKGWYTKVHAKYLFRPFTKKMAHDRLLARIEKNADRLIALYRFFRKAGVGKIMNRFLPVCDIDATLPTGLDPQTLREWVILDTFDMFSPAHDHPQRLRTVVKWFADAGLVEVAGDVVEFQKGNFVTAVRGKKPASASG